MTDKLVLALGGVKIWSSAKSVSVLNVKSLQDQFSLILSFETDLGIATVFSCLITQAKANWAALKPCVDANP